MVFKCTHISNCAQGIKELVGALQSRGVAVYLISGGFRELTVPIARELGVPCENVFANRMNWQARLVCLQRQNTGVRTIVG